MRLEHIKGKAGPSYFALFQPSGEGELLLRATSALTTDSVQAFVVPPDGHIFVGLCGGSPLSLDTEIALLSGDDTDIPLSPFHWNIKKSNVAGIPNDTTMRRDILSTVLADRDVYADLSVAAMAVNI